MAVLPMCYQTSMWIQITGLNLTINDLKFHIQYHRKTISLLHWSQGKSSDAVLSSY